LETELEYKYDYGQGLAWRPPGITLGDGRTLVLDPT
jgi:hypothetical protein